MDFSHSGTGPQAVDLHNIKPWPGKSWPTRSKLPTTARSRGWKRSIGRTCKALGLHREQARQQYDPTYKNCDKLFVQPAEPASSYTPAQLVTEVCKLQNRPKLASSNQPLAEGALLNLLYAALDNQKHGIYGIRLPYRPGSEEQDSKLISAAAHYVERQHRKRAQAALRSQQSDLFYLASLHSSRREEQLSKPVKPHKPVIATSNPPQKRKFELICDQDTDLPRRSSKQIQKTPKPFPSAINSSSGSSKATTNHAPNNNTSILPSISQQPSAQLEPKRPFFYFGNRIEQALFKIDKWADSWLSGAMPQTDLAWESFEFCLRMPDVLEQWRIAK